jgi:hypothetical protein
MASELEVARKAFQERAWRTAPSQLATAHREEAFGLDDQLDPALAARGGSLIPGTRLVTPVTPCNVSLTLRPWKAPQSTAKHRTAPGFAGAVFMLSRFHAVA